MEYKGTLSSALEFAEAGRLEEWIHTYLCTDGRNEPFSKGLRLLPRYYLAPAGMPLSLFTRCCGPEEHMKWRVDEEGFERRVSALMEAIREKADIPPLIVHYFTEEDGAEGRFELNDGNHRLEAFRRLGIGEYAVIIWITEKWEFERFTETYLK